MHTSFKIVIPASLARLSSSLIASETYEAVTMLVLCLIACSATYMEEEYKNRCRMKYIQPWGALLRVIN